MVADPASTVRRGCCRVPVTGERQERSFERAFRASITGGFVARRPTRRRPPTGSGDRSRGVGQLLGRRRSRGEVDRHPDRVPERVRHDRPDQATIPRPTTSGTTGMSGTVSTIPQPSRDQQAMISMMLSSGHRARALGVAIPAQPATTAAGVAPEPATQPGPEPGPMVAAPRAAAQKRAPDHRHEPGTGTRTRTNSPQPPRHRRPHRDCSRGCTVRASASRETGRPSRRALASVLMSIAHIALAFALNGWWFNHTALNRRAPTRSPRSAVEQGRQRAASPG